MMHKYLQKKRYYIFILIFLLISTRLSAGDIDGVEGFKLGQVLDKQLIVQESRADDGSTVYTVKKNSQLKQFDILTVRINTQHRIHRISAYSKTMSGADCADRMSDKRKGIEKQFPNLGYYAMEQSEMFFQDERVFTLECVNYAGGTRLLQEYSDDKLARENK